MKTVDLLKAATGAACLVFALGANAQAATDNNTSTTMPETTTGTAADNGTGMHHTAKTHESAGQGLKDGTITTKVKAELLATKNLTSTHIHVKTRHGTVHLTGTVPSQEEKSTAGDVAKGVSGVKSVKNRLKVTNE